MTEDILIDILEWIAVICLLGGWLLFMFIAWDKMDKRRLGKLEVFKDVDPEAPNLAPYDPHTLRWRNEMIERERPRDEDLGL